MKYIYERATTKDEEELRQFIASMPMPGSVSIRLERNPDYFSAAAVEGSSGETLIVRAENGSITGIGNRAEKEMYVNGEKKTVGYLSGLRVSQNHRSLKYLTKAYKELQKLHEEGNCSFYISTIVDDNERARKVLESGRGFLPKYKYIGDYLTFVLDKNISPIDGVQIRQANEKDLPALIQFLNEEGSKRQFFPAYNEEDFKSGLLKKLDINSVFVAVDEEKIIGCMGIWDQHQFKQVIIDSYSTLMSLSKPFYNFQAGLLGKPKLPNVGEDTNNLKVAIPLAKDDDQNVLRSLLSHACKKATKLKRHLLYGIHEKEPFSCFLKTLNCRLYTSRVYTVNWPDGVESVQSINSKQIPYFELGGL